MSLYYTTTNRICRHCSPVWKWMVLNSHHTGFFKCSRIISIIHPPAFPQSAPHQDSETPSPLTSFSLYPFHTLFQHNLEHLHTILDALPFLYRQIGLFAQPYSNQLHPHFLSVP